MTVLYEGRGDPGCSSTDPEGLLEGAAERGSSEDVLEASTKGEAEALVAVARSIECDVCLVLGRDGDLLEDGGCCLVKAKISSIEENNLQLRLCKLIESGRLDFWGLLGRLLVLAGTTIRDLRHERLSRAVGTRDWLLFSSRVLLEE
jgi:hypothetical protein